MRVIGYLRVSSEEQAESGLGLAAQRYAIEQGADRLGLPLAETFTDGAVSGGADLDKRPALLAALATLRRGDVLLVAKRDRLARDVALACLIEREVAKRGATIRTAGGEGDGDDAASILLRRILDAMAEHERSLIRSRTKSALAARSRQGMRVSRHAPIGSTFTTEGRIEASPEEAAAVESIRSMRARGFSYRRIAAALDSMGVPSRTGAPWNHSTIRSVCTRVPVAA